MAIAVNTILNHIKTVLATLSNLTAERIHIGPIEATRVGTSPHVVIVEQDEPGDRIDGGLTYRQLRVVIGVVMRIDTVKGDVDVQINATYQPIHAKLETLCDGVTSTFETMMEDEEGPSSDTAWDQVALRTKSCGWTIAFDRTLGSTE